MALRECEDEEEKNQKKESATIKENILQNEKNKFYVEQLKYKRDV